MFYESLIILNISTLNFSEGVPASVIGRYDKKKSGFIAHIIAENCIFLFAQLSRMNYLFGKKAHNVRNATGTQWCKEYDFGPTNGPS